jgi:ABC-2 type transport system permease protein
MTPKTQSASRAREGHIRRLRALVIKEFHQLIRDPSAFILSGFLPLLLLFLYGFGVSLDMDEVKIALTLEDTAPDAQSFAQALTNSTYFRVTPFPSWEGVPPAIIFGRIKGAVVVPSYFSAFRDRQDEVAPIQVIADGSEPNTASFVQNYVQAAWQGWLAEQAISTNLGGQPLVTGQQRFWFNPSLESHYFLVPGSIAIIMTLIGTLLTALVVAREWERGTMEALMATPVTIGELLIGKLIPYFLLGIGSMCVATCLALLVFQVPLRGSFLLLTLVASIFLLYALSVGLLISTLARNQFVAAQIAMVSSFLPAVVLSGFVFEISSMPFLIRGLTRILAPRYFVSSLQTLFLVGNVWRLVLIDMACMAGLAAIVFVITATKTRKRLD